MKRKIQNILSVTLILAGLGFLLFPTYDYLYQSYWEQKLLREYEESLLHPTVPPPTEDDALAEHVLSNLNEVFNNFDDSRIFREATSDPVAETTSGEVETTTKPKPAPKLNVIGKIMIEKINLKMPIIDTTNDTTLNYGATHIDGTTAIGQIGNCGIAGHRMRKYGRFFNRLNELEAGDEILVESGGIPYKYKVTSLSIVEPNDTSVLNRNKVSSILTLITCETADNPTHRLVVHASLVQE